MKSLSEPPLKVTSPTVKSVAASERVNVMTVVSPMVRVSSAVVMAIVGGVGTLAATALPRVTTPSMTSVVVSSVGFPPTSPVILTSSILRSKSKI